MEENRRKSRHVITYFLFYSLVFHRAHDSEVVYEVFHRLMRSFSEMQTAYPDGLTSGLVCRTKQKNIVAFKVVLSVAELKDI